MRQHRVRADIALLLLAVPILLLPACGRLQDRSMCREYADFRTAVAEVQGLAERGIREAHAPSGHSKIGSSQTTGGGLRPIS